MVSFRAWRALFLLCAALARGSPLYFVKSESELAMEKKGLASMATAGPSHPSTPLLPSYYPFSDIAAPSPSRRTDYSFFSVPYLASPGSSDDAVLYPSSASSFTIEKKTGPARCAAEINCVSMPASFPSSSQSSWSSDFAIPTVYSRSEDGGGEEEDVFVTVVLTQTEYSPEFPAPTADLESKSDHSIATSVEASETSSSNVPYTTITPTESFQFWSSTKTAGSEVSSTTSASRTSTALEAGKGVEIKPGMGTRAGMGSTSTTPTELGTGNSSITQTSDPAVSTLTTAPLVFTLTVTLPVEIVQYSDTLEKEHFSVDPTPSAV